MLRKFIISILGQSNARGLRIEAGDKVSGITVLQDILQALAHAPVIAAFKNADGKFNDLAIGGSRVNGNSTDTAYYQSKDWWFTDTDTPGPVLLKVIDTLSKDLAAQKAQGADVELSFVWGQGETDAHVIAAAHDKAAAIEQYRINTLKVFDTLKAHFGGDLTIYMMQTGRFLADAASARGYSDRIINAIEYGREQVQQVQEEIASARSDVKIAVNYEDLPMAHEVSPVQYADDPWHLDSDAREEVGARLAEYIALDKGLTHILHAPGHLPQSALADITIHAGDAFRLGGTSAADLMTGTTGSDTLSGGSGDDTLIGGAGADAFNGGNGADIFFFQRLGDSTRYASDRITHFEQGKDRIDLSALSFTDIHAGKAMGSVLGFQTVGGNTVILDSSHQFRLILTGEYTLTKSDFLGLGRAEHPGVVLEDTGGNDAFYGTKGDDTIHGGVGQDTVLGGEGADHFVFSAITDSSATSRDVILDFEAGVDKIDLSGLGFHGITHGRTDVGELRYVYSATSDRTYIIDLHGTFQLFLQGDHSQVLEATDFIF